ncbi:HNH endonuclease domain-containing protein [Pedobacter steynii]
MSSIYLNKLSIEDRKSLLGELHTIQNGKCFITGEPIDLIIHKNALDVDHVIPTKMGGKDEKSNFALTFSSANRAKQASDLNLARIIHSFIKVQENLKKTEDRSPNLDDVLKLNDGAKYPLVFDATSNKVRYSFSEIDEHSIIEQDVYTDKLSGLKYFFTSLPIEYIHS